MNRYLPDNSVSAAANRSNWRSILGSDLEQVPEDVILNILAAVRLNRKEVAAAHHGDVSNPVLSWILRRM